MTHRTSTLFPILAAALAAGFLIAPPAVLAGSPEKSPGAAKAADTGASAPSACRTARFPFAHCAETGRNFHAVLVAVPGRHGSCKTDFARRTASIRSTLPAPRAFDLDCFAYDPASTGFEAAATALIAQIGALQALGYREVAIAAHGTGGIVALTAVIRALETGALDGVRIASMHLWATPMEGLKPGAEKHRLLTATLPADALAELSGAAPLAALKAHLAARANDPRMPKIAWQTGRPADPFARPVSKQAAHDAGWLRPGDAFETGTRMSAFLRGGRMARDTGGFLAAWPKRLFASTAFDSLAFAPRLDAAFPAEPPVQTLRTVRRQMLVARALGAAGREDFIATYEQHLPFLARLFRDRMRRSAKVDAVIMDDFFTAFAERAKTPDAALMKFMDAYVAEIVLPHDPRTGIDTRRFLHGRAQLPHRIVTSMEMVRKTAAIWLRANPGKDALLARAGGLEALQQEALEVTLAYLGSPHAPVQFRALNILRDTLGTHDPAVITRTDAAASVLAFYKARYGRLSANAKAVMGDTLLALAAHGGEIAEETMGLLTQRVEWHGKDRPLWTTLDSDEWVERAIARIDPADALGPHDFDLLVGVIENAGARGANHRLALAALNKAEQALRITAQLVALQYPNASGAQSPAGFIGRQTRQLEAAGAGSKFRAVRVSVARSIERIQLAGRGAAQKAAAAQSTQ